MTVNRTGGRSRAVAIGASAGAVEALTAILPGLPAGTPLAVFVVVHIPADRVSVMVDLFRSRCNMEVREAEDKEPVQEGTVYFAPPDYHLLVELDRRLSLSSEEPVQFCRPAIDVLFESAAEAYGPELVGVVLTGANADGAKGLRAICEAGGVAVVQRPSSALSPTMPEAALAACPTARVLGLSEIAVFLQELATNP